MSAWIVMKGHIDAMVQALAVEGLIEWRDATDTGVMLWEECRRSVAYRYPGDADGEWPGPIGLTKAGIAAYEFRGIESPLNPAIVQQQFYCYDYQTCEHPEYPESEAFKLVRTYIDLMQIRHGDRFEDKYEKANGARMPWGVDEIEECVG